MGYMYLEIFHFINVFQNLFPLVTQVLKSTQTMGQATDGHIF